MPGSDILSVITGYAGAKARSLRSFNKSQPAGNKAVNFGRKWISGTEIG
jgi:hypothetical protein